MATPGVDYPEDRSVLDVKAVSRDDVLTSFVEEATGGELVISVGEDASRRRVRLEPGEVLELVWRGPEELRSVPAVLLDVRGGDAPTWRVRIAGPASRGQRRSAVRVPITLDVTVHAGGEHRTGTTVDLSEGGIHCLLDGEPDRSGALEVGSVVHVSLDLDGRALATKAEVIRRHPREDKRPELSLRFIGLKERDEDDVRRRVFAQMRDLRSRGLI
ncbi:flagellar brake protein [Geodermatophilus sp. SYSU D01106]